MLAALGTFGDRAHYTYDTRVPDVAPATTRDGWYARDAVGLYLAPEETHPEIIGAEVARVRGFIEPFRALPVRYVWIVDAPAHDEPITDVAVLDEEWSDDVS